MNSCAFVIAVLGLLPAVVLPLTTTTLGAFESNLIGFCFIIGMGATGLLVRNHFDRRE
jgi:hypothetical protein